MHNLCQYYINCEQIKVYFCGALPLCGKGPPECPRTSPTTGMDKCSPDAVDTMIWVCTKPLGAPGMSAITSSLPGPAASPSRAVSQGLSLESNSFRPRSAAGSDSRTSRDTPCPAGILPKNTDFGWAASVPLMVPTRGTLAPFKDSGPAKERVAETGPASDEGSSVT